MKPTKNRVFCMECGRSKMLFETEKKAQLFMKFNNEDIATENKNVPVRAYYCDACCGWHLTHISAAFAGPSRTDQAIERMRTTINIKREAKQRASVIQKETCKTVQSKLALIDKHIANNENESAEKLVDDLLEMSKNKYITPGLLKKIKEKKEFFVIN